MSDFINLNMETFKIDSYPSIFTWKSGTITEQDVISSPTKTPVKCETESRLFPRLLDNTKL